MIVHPTEREFVRASKNGEVIPIYTELLADLETPVSAYIKLRGKKGRSFLLESVERGEEIGRYSFIGVEPYMTLEAIGSRVELCRGRKRVVIEDDPLSVIVEELKRFRYKPSADLPPFTGGAIGYIGYDYIRQVESLPPAPPDDLNLPDAVFLFCDRALIFDHLRHKIKLVANVFVDDDPIEAYRTGRDNLAKMLAALRKPLGHTGRARAGKARLNIRSNMSRKQFMRMVEKSKEFIRAGDIFQVVLSQRFQTSITTEPLDIYRALRSINPSPYMFFLDAGPCVLVGSSPESLVKVKDGVVTTRPIAGTRPRSQDPREDARLARELLADAKERAEHTMLVDLGRNDIGRVSEYGSVTVPDLMVVEKYSHVMHIVSTVRGDLAKGLDAAGAIRSCFPAGTVSGAPKIRAMQIIDDFEPTRRGPYAGAVGYFSFTGDADVAITIRTVVVKGHSATVQAGAGIVFDSDPAREYEETMNKARALLQAVQNAEEGIEG